MKVLNQTPFYGLKSNIEKNPNLSYFSSKHISRTILKVNYTVAQLNLETFPPD